jgi:hypothetical protein
MVSWVFLPRFRYSFISGLDWPAEELILAALGLRQMPTLYHTFIVLVLASGVVLATPAQTLDDTPRQSTRNELARFMAA